MTATKIKFDVLKETQILSMHDRQQQPIIKLTPLEQFYTNVSKVYDHELDEDEEEEEEEEEDDDDDDNDNEGVIIDNLDKARYQLDSMCRVIDMLTNNRNNELLYKLSRPLIYPQMNRRHFCAISQQKENQFNETIDIFRNGIKSVSKSIDRGREFSKNLIFLSKYWRLTTMDVLKNENNFNRHNKHNDETKNNQNDRMNVFIDYRLQRKNNDLNGLLPLKSTKKTGNIQIYVNNESELIKYLKNIKNDDDDDDDDDDDGIIGFDDDEDDDDDDDDDDDNNNDDVFVLDDWWRICEYIYHSQISLLYFELFNVLRVEASHWNPKYYEGIRCKLESNGITVHSPSMNDFLIQFSSPKFIENKIDEIEMNKWNKFAICGICDNQQNEEKLSKEIEEIVIKMLFKKWNYKYNKYNKPLFIDNTLNKLKNEELKYWQNLNGRTIFNLNNLIGKFEGNINIKENNNDDIIDYDYNQYQYDDDNMNNMNNNDYNECELLEYIINKINHYRIKQGIKQSLKSFSMKHKNFQIKWKELNSKSIVYVTIEKKDKLLLNITLNGIKIIVIKYGKHKQRQCSKVTQCSNIQHLHKLLP